MKTSVLLVLLAACGAAVAWPRPRPESHDGLLGDDEVPHVKAVVVGVLLEGGGSGPTPDDSGKQNEAADLQAMKSLLSAVQEELANPGDGLQGPDALQGADGLRGLDGLLQDPDELRGLDGLLQGPDGLRGLDGLLQGPDGLRGLDGLLQGPGELRGLDGLLQGPGELRGLDGLLQGPDGLRGLDGLLQGPDGLRGLDGLLKDGQKQDGDSPQAQDDDDDDEREEKELGGTLVPRDDWWKCKVDNCRRNCNNQGKNGACVGPVCVCWS
ncbi:Collagen alpha-1(XXIV) chain [Frankliniella fusca]|uniref:Collagen alpha-1(XXIV) chain n=1 Tax=Frankliniella fusca TaxID=407009 RepID=A0AAE1GRF3_9NEOP|nr:Collagen alpha-1(XXIV) chain [Frankliniella fusca]